ncbi:MAG: RHS repeat-associated core domain-containing protein [Actinobacteria bacterium]|nr:RHS repeat-associated core domain-containing protein [Actinomycetota bacterium]
MSRVRVQVAGHAASRAAGVAGFLFTVSRADAGTAAGLVRVRLSYARFASAYGGGFGSRLAVVAMPACALTTPSRPACRVTRPVRTVNHATARTLTAQVTAAPAATASPMVFAATASTSGGTGDYKATSLTPSATWQVGLQSGDFTWSYPLRAPPPIGGSAPSLTLAYDSGATDGETAQDNSQPGQVGEGFALGGGGYIERKYASCADHVGDSSNATDQKSKTGDLCWDGDNAYLNLDGRATQLIHDSSSGTWHLASDDGSKVEELTGATNGAHSGQYWKVTTTDGTQYIFGENQLPGWVTGDPTTNSAWTVPVVGLKSGDPCHNASYASASCLQAWRWNLDLVIDPNGNATEYFYNRETSYYSFDSTATANGTKKQYTTGGTLAEIDYGSQMPNVYNRRPIQVVFGYADRCTSATQSTCDANHNGTYWPDTPWDLYCTSTAACTGAGHDAPAFFDTQMLTSVTTQVFEGSGVGNVPVDTWTLGHQWLSSEGNEDLWLSSITHTGKVGGSKALGPVTFSPIAMINRVPGDGYPAMTKYRMSAITTETGGRIQVTYNPPDCGSSRPAPSTDTLPCFQQWWSPGDPQLGEAPLESWFYKYTVAEVDVSDQTGGQPDMPTYYTYVGGAAWHYDTDIDLVLPKHKSYSQWRGYQHVHVVTGNPSGTQTQTNYTFMRGMDHDPILPGGGFASASVTDSRGDPAIPDSQRADGFLLEKITYNGPGGAMISDEISTPWLSPPTATSASQPWGGTLTAVLEGTAQTDTYAPLASGGTRHTQVSNSFDSSTGLLTQASDLGDVSVASQALCTAYSYAQNTSTGLLDYPSEEKVTAGACGTSSPPLVSDTQYIYDNGTLGSAPTAGNVTRTQVWSNGDPGVAGHEVFTSRDTYDAYGRVTASQDAAGNTTTTSYTSAYGTGRATTQTVVTDPMQHATTTDINPEWGSPKDTIDANGETTSYSYDPLGRVTSVWLPGQSEAAHDPATYTYAYALSSTLASAVTTNRLINASAKLYDTSIALFDSLLRPRQTQTPAEGVTGGTEVTDTFYDSRGNVVTQNGPYPANTSPSTNVWNTTEPAVPNETASTYDGGNRVTSQEFDSYGTQKWTTTNAYPGTDAVTKTPPPGGTITTTYTDARGRTSEIDQYHSKTSPTGAYDATTYTYTPAGKLASITDPAGNKWSNTYDLLGRQVTATAPDTGTTTSGYNDLGQLTSVTDARGKTVSYTYDPDGRKTAAYDTTDGAAESGTDQLAAWTYDSPAVGQLASATSYTGGTGGASFTQTVNSYDPAYQPTSTTYNISSSIAGALNGSYTFGATYNADGTLASETYPAGGGLPAETVFHGYNNMGDPSSAWSSVSDYVQQSFYAPDRQPAEIDLGTSQSALWSRLLYSYDPATARLSEARVQQESTNWGNAADVSYGYDPAGDVTSISDSVAGDTQCLNYDYAQRLTAAWAQSGATCPASPPGASGLGGPAPYQQQLTYDSAGAGNITENDLTYPGGNTSSTAVSYPAAGAAQPHAATSATDTVNGAAATTTDTYLASGQLHTTSGNGPSQTFTWNDAGQLSAESDSTGGTVNYRYDASGNLLVRQDNTVSTLYLPGEELTASGATVTATRYYTHGGQVIAARTPAGVSWLAGDPHGTDTLAIDASTQAVTQRWYTPFGAPRGTAPSSWPGDRGFVGGTTDPATGLTNLGAREYNPLAQVFISTDPLQKPYDPQNLNPYAYAEGNPATNSDPTGLSIPGSGGSHDPCGIGQRNCHGGGGNTGTGNQSNPGNNGNNGNNGLPVPQIVAGLPHASQIVAAYQHQLHTVWASYGSHTPEYIQWLALAQACLNTPSLCPAYLASNARYQYALGNVQAQAATTAYYHHITRGQGYQSIAIALGVAVGGAALTEILGGLAAGDAAVPAQDAGANVVRHYTTQEAADAITKSGFIRPGAASGKIWLTPDEYATGPEAQARLALPRTPEGYFKVPMERVPEPSAPSIVEPYYGQPGGGTEITTEYPIDVSGLPFLHF